MTEPWAKFIVPAARKMTVKPNAISAYTEPSARPLMTIG